MLLTGAAVSNIEKEKQAKIKALETATPSDLLPHGDLANKFNLMSEHTDIQRENTEKEIIGKVVQWSLPVYEIKKIDLGYRVQTQTQTDFYTAVGSIIEISPRNDQERSEIETLTEGDTISFKGYIKGVSLRHIEISPALLISRKEIELAEAAKAKKAEEDRTRAAKEARAEATKEWQAKLNGLESAAVSELLPFIQTHSALDRNNVGQVVEWNMLVSDASQADNIFIIEAYRNMFYTLRVIINISPRNAEERSKIASLKKGDAFKFRGYIHNVADNDQLVVVGPAILSKEDEYLVPVAREIKEIESVSLSKEFSYDELTDDNGKTTLQKEVAVEKFKNQIVQWTLNVEHLIKPGYGYIVVARKENAKDDKHTDIYLFPRSPEEKLKIESMKKGDPVTFRGYLEEISEFKFQISPATLILGENESRANQSTKQQPVTPPVVEPVQEDTSNLPHDISDARMQMDRDRLALERERLELEQQKLAMARKDLNAVIPEKVLSNSDVLEPIKPTQNKEEALGPKDLKSSKESSPEPLKGLWIFQDSSQRRLTKTDLAGLNADQLWRARNEIYARNGLIFSTPRGRAFAGTLGDQYHGTDNSQEGVFGRMNEIEKANVEMIKKLE